MSNKPFLLIAVAIAFTVVTLPTDVTAQTTTQTIRSYSANSGLYSNTIINFTPPNPYTEVCFVGGVLMSDVHAAGGAPVGGNCVPGDTGWMIEIGERQPAPWDQARANCLMDGMRLAEPFEWRQSCRNAGALMLNGMTNNTDEWASNFATHQSGGGLSWVAAAILGGDNCAFGAYGSIGNTAQVEDVLVYRCVR